jgi:hypothetical protein
MQLTLSDACTGTRIRSVMYVLLALFDTPTPQVIACLRGFFRSPEGSELLASQEAEALGTPSVVIFDHPTFCERFKVDGNERASPGYTALSHHHQGDALRLVSCLGLSPPVSRFFPLPPPPSHRSTTSPRCCTSGHRRRWRA